MSPRIELYRLISLNIVNERITNVSLYIYIISNSVFSNRVYSVGDIVYCRGGYRTLGGYNHSGK